MAGIARTEGQRSFGNDPAGYDQARPDYPPQVYDILRDRCGLQPGVRTLEILPALRPGISCGSVRLRL